LETLNLHGKLDPWNQAAETAAETAPTAQETADAKAYFFSKITNMTAIDAAKESWKADAHLLLQILPEVQKKTDAGGEYEELLDTMNSFIQFLISTIFRNERQK
jgi:hypothetical protein